MDAVIARVVEQYREGLRGAALGTRNLEVNKAAYGLLSLAACGMIDPASAKKAVYEAAEQSGLGAAEIETVLASAQRSIEAGGPSRQSIRLSGRGRSTPRPPKKRIDPIALREYWRTAQPLSVAAAEFLRLKRIDPGAVRGLVRCVAPCAWYPYPDHPLAVMLYDAGGIPASITSRRISDVSTPNCKTVLPPGVDSSGALMANPMALSWMGGAAHESVIVAEGVTDWLRWCAEMPDRAIIGVISASMRGIRLLPWGRVSCAYVVTHDDPAGERYAQVTYRAAVRSGVRVRRGCYGR